MEVVRAKDLQKVPEALSGSVRGGEGVRAGGGRGGVGGGGVRSIYSGHN
jgi:hypothetical protein